MKLKLNKKLLGQPARKDTFGLMEMKKVQQQNTAKTQHLNSQNLGEIQDADESYYENY
jgi:hypothetical protein